MYWQWQQWPWNWMRTDDWSLCRVTWQCRTSKCLEDYCIRPFQHTCPNERTLGFLSIVCDKNSTTVKPCSLHVSATNAYYFHFCKCTVLFSTDDSTWNTFKWYHKWVTCILNAVEPVFKDCPIGHENMVSRQMVSVWPARNMWPFKTGPDMSLVSQDRFHHVHCK